jgi:outer membrane lipoprotein SlyB
MSKRHESTTTSLALTRLRIFIAAVLLQACATTTTTAWTYTAPPGPAWSRPGFVESVREVVRRTEGNPAGGAVAGALVGGLLFSGHHGPSMLGALAGAAVGASVSQERSELRTYEVFVRFDDGGLQVVAYQGASPFSPGQPVVMTPQGLYAR